MERNRVWIAVKYFPLSLLLQSPFFTFLRFAFQAYGAIVGLGAAGRFSEAHSPGKLLRILLKAYLAAVRGLPGMWRKRREIKRRTRVNEGEIRTWFTRFGMSAREISWKD